MEHNNADVWKVMFLFKWAIFGFYVNFEGCTLPETNSKCAPETLGVGSDEFPFRARPTNRCELLVFGGVTPEKMAIE